MMYVAEDDAREAMLDKLAARMHDKLPPETAPNVEAFARQYYAEVAPDDLLGRSVLDLYGAVLAHWHLATQRSPGTAKVRAYNPDVEEHGWRSTHTVIETVNDDMPFLVDSVTMELNRHGLTIHLVVHPVMRLRRDEQGRLVEVLSRTSGLEPGPGHSESVMHIEVDRQTEPEFLEVLEADLERVLGDVRAVVEDWRPMRATAERLVAELDRDPPPVDPEEGSEAAALLRWMADDHFTFLGFREYDLISEGGDEVLRAVPNSGLGILRDARTGAPLSASFAKLPPEVRTRAREPHLLVLTKANSVATVHRPAYMDYIGVKRIDPSGQVVGERRFLGLFTSAAYNSYARDIPVLRRKVAAVMARAGFPPRSHNEKALLNILETYPRDELFQAFEDELSRIAMGILHLAERQRLRLFTRHDIYCRFVSCLVFVPRDRYNTRSRQRMEGILRQAFCGTTVEFNARLSESVLARLQFVVHTPSGIPDYDVTAIEGRLVEATRTWDDDLHLALLEHCGEERGNELHRRYADGFPAAYREDFPARNAVFDIERMEELGGDDALAMSLYRPLEAPEGLLRFKLFRRGRPLPLSDLLPTLENMGVKVLDEHPYEIRAAGVEPVWIHDLGLAYAAEAGLEADKVRGVFSDAFARVWRGEAENDGFNRLVLGARLTWREITVLRACSKYLRQLGSAFSQSYMEETLARNPHIARALVELFRARLDPSHPAAAGAAGADPGRRGAELAEELGRDLDAVANLDEDRILRSFLNVVQATLRTNYFQRDHQDRPKPYLSLKLDPARIPEVPLPRPLFEILVYSPRTEAVHLRGGRVARGGIRWSDRREDFRTEVLGLMKAQMVKNAVIVPVGAKGGFVVKRPPAGGDRDALLEEVVDCYRTFMRGMLDLTDNLVGGKAVPPADVVRHDGDDPYLVVAADKGTATFSDLANSIAAEYGFWLGDAFASGGSTGYDHKRMGITARGAWESVRRHFRELGIDTSTTDFSVVGIGDMSGDVFGNGMLLSPHIRLVAAFNHLHVFLDPDPDPAAGFEERRRLFELPRSSWSGYDPARISAGGGVFARSAKSVPISPEVRQVLGIDAGVSALTPNEVIRAILRAPVDLLWNGGIGTYVKASTESHADVGDRANDGLRVDGRELRCRVVGEGGNLGFTQLGRVEYALAGGGLNTDFIDNSAGVDCSDHEVNLKVLLDQVVADGDLTEKQRNQLLAEMAEEVARLVLLDNYRQAEALSISQAGAADLVEAHGRVIRALERSGRLDRALEFLPDDESLAERKASGRGLTRPELSVLLAYSKTIMKGDLLASDLPEDDYLARELERYLPGPVLERFAERIPHHRLRREIVATRVANSIVNRVSITFAHRLREEAGASSPDIARCYMVAREVFDQRSMWAEIMALDAVIDAEVHTAMMLRSRRLLEHASLWLLRHRPQPLDIAATVACFAPGAETIAASLPRLLAASDLAAFERVRADLADRQVPAELAERVAGLEALFSALDVVEVAGATGRGVEEVAAVYFQLGARLDLHWLYEMITALPTASRWQLLSRAALREDLYQAQRALTAAVFRLGPERAGPSERIEAWAEANRDPLLRCTEVLGDLRSGGAPDIAMLSVALREMRSLVEAGARQARAELAGVGGRWRPN